MPDGPELKRAREYVKYRKRVGDWAGAARKAEQHMAAFEPFCGGCGESICCWTCGPCTACEAEECLETPTKQPRVEPPTKQPCKELPTKQPRVEPPTKQPCTELPTKLRKELHEDCGCEIEEGYIEAWWCDTMSADHNDYVAWYQDLALGGIGGSDSDSDYHEEEEPESEDFSEYSSEDESEERVPQDAAGPGATPRTPCRRPLRRSAGTASRGAPLRRARAGHRKTQAE